MALTKTYGGVKAPSPQAKGKAGGKTAGNPAAAAKVVKKTTPAR